MVRFPEALESIVSHRDNDEAKVTVLVGIPFWNFIL